MRIPLVIVLMTVILLFAVDTHAQKRKPVQPPGRKAAISQKTSEVGNQAVVIDEMLSVLRQKPSLFAGPVQRMRRGRKVTVMGVAEADGVKFYKVAAPPSSFGWVQADSVFAKFRAGDEERLARLVQASDGFDQIEIATEFFKLYPDSKFRASVLLLFGDLLEEVAVKLSRDANGRLRRGEMAASAAPMHSYFLNFVSLDRYRKLGILFLFNSSARAFHYDGASWREIETNYPAAAEAVEARKRLTSLTEKMGAQSAK
jgi:hypothetical protein